jgi:transposase-like protein
MTKTKDTTFFESKLLGFIAEEDPLPWMVQWMTQRLVAMAHKIGAEEGRHGTNRVTYRSGIRVRRFDTRLGTLYLAIPKLRKGGYIPLFVMERKRSELAVVEVIQEAWRNGVSTGKIERAAKSLGIELISASQVSEINKGLDGMVEEFHNRLLDAEYPVVWVDALYEKIREGRRVQVIVVKGVNTQGMPQILAVGPMENELEKTYRALFARLRERGLKKVKLEPDKESATACAQRLAELYGQWFPQAIECLDVDLEDSLQFYAFTEIDHRKIASSNTLERLSREIGRRSRVVGIFPSIGSCLWLVSTSLIECKEDWQSGRSHIKAESLAKYQVQLTEAA